MSSRLTIDERDRLRRQAERQARIDERKAREEAEEEAERTRLRELASQHTLVDPDPPGVAEHSHSHRRVGSGNLEALLAAEESERSAQLDRLITDAPVNAAAPGSKLRGFDAEIAQRLKDKEDPELMMRAGRWIEAITDEPCFDMYTCLKNGVTLCKLIDAIKPGSLGASGYNKRSNHMAQRDNILLYLKACDKLGMTSAEMFEISDLHENRNMASVVSNLVALSRRARFLGFSGPFLETGSNAAAPPLITGSQRKAPAFSHRRSRSDLPGDTLIQQPQHAASMTPAAREVYNSSAPEAVQARKGKNAVRKSRPRLPIAVDQTNQDANGETVNFCPQCGWDHVNKRPGPEGDTTKHKDDTIAQLRAQIDLLRLDDKMDTEVVAQQHELDEFRARISELERENSQLERENSKLKSRSVQPNLAPNTIAVGKDDSNNFAASDVIVMHASRMRSLSLMLVGAAFLSIAACVGVGIILEPWESGHASSDWTVFGIQVGLGTVLAITFASCAIIARKRARRLSLGYSQLP